MSNARNTNKKRKGAPEPAHDDVKDELSERVVDMSTFFVDSDKNVPVPLADMRAILERATAAHESSLNREFIHAFQQTAGQREAFTASAQGQALEQIYPAFAALCNGVVAEENALRESIARRIMVVSRRPSIYRENESTTVVPPPPLFTREEYKVLERYAETYEAQHHVNYVQLYLLNSFLSQNSENT